MPLRFADQVLVEQLSPQSPPVHKTKPQLIGSDAWEGENRFEDQAKRLEARQGFTKVKWDTLAKIASDHRNGLPCAYVGNFTFGRCNMIRRLDFEDGVSWIVRVILEPEKNPSDPEFYDCPRAFGVEAAVTKLLKTKTIIPAPTIHAYDADASNKAGAPYLFMDYIHGTPANQLTGTTKGEDCTFGTPNQDARFRAQMAKIQAQLLSLKFDQIGSLYWSDETSTFSIGRDLVTGKGPWTRPNDYFRDVTDVLLKRTVKRAPIGASTSAVFSIPAITSHLLSICSQERSRLFRLAHQDFGAHNTLVDAGFNIVGLLDLEAVAALPLEAVAQFPATSGMDAALPGSTRPARDALSVGLREDKERRMREYKNRLTGYEAEFSPGTTPVAGRLGSIPAVLYSCFGKFDTAGEGENEVLLKSMLYTLRAFARRADGLF